MINHVDFEFRDFEGSLQELVPLIDGRSLVERVAEFERDQRFDVVGGYAGLVLAHFKFGDLRQYLVGGQQPWPGERVPLLGCDCGEWGCWPLLATVTREAAVVSWSSFEQPHRPARDYSGFGPFIFETAAYLAAVDAVADPTI